MKSPRNFELKLLLRFLQKYFIVPVWVSVFLFCISDFALAGKVTQSFTLSGTLLQAGGSTPLLDAAAKIKVSVLDPSKTCLLYEEEQTVNTSGSAGYYSLRFGTNTGDTHRTASDPGLSMTQVYQNTAAVTAANAPSATCVGLSYTPATRDIRYLRITVTPSATSLADVLSPDAEMGSVPQAVIAETLQGYAPSQLLILGAGDLTQANLQTVFATGNAAKLSTLLTVGQI